jgi:hypothetical protein
MGFDALHQQGLLNDEEYLASPFFRRTLHDGTKIETFMDAFVWIWNTMSEGERGPVQPWQDDTAALEAAAQAYLEKAQDTTA